MLVFIRNCLRLNARLLISHKYEVRDTDIPHVYCPLYDQMWAERTFWKTHKWILCSVKMSIECDTTEQASHRSPTQINHTTIAFQFNSFNISTPHNITNRTNSVDGHNLNFMAFILRSSRTRLPNFFWWNLSSQSILIYFWNTKSWQFLTRTFLYYSTFYLVFILVFITVLMKANIE